MVTPARALAWIFDPAPVSARPRLMATLLVLLAQTAMFAWFWPVPVEVISDNIRYERAGWNLAQGRGLSLTLEDINDPTVRGWVCDRHPELCTEGGLAPTAVYPPGYSWFIAAVYLVAGRSLVALLLSQLLLLWAAFAMFESVAVRLLDRAGYAAAMVIAAGYPFLARQATFVMSDTLHATLVMAAIWVLIRFPSSIVRGIAFGVALATATLTRPYLVAALPGLFLIPWVRRGAAMPRKEWLVAGLAAALCFGGWAGRNAVLFGRFIPFSTGGLGLSLVMNKCEWTVGVPFDAPEIFPKYAAAVRIHEVDPLRWERNRELMQEGVAWMKENPGLVAISVVKRIPRLWVSLGTEPQPSPVVVVGAVLSSALLLLGLWGAWRVRRDGRWAAMLVVIASYWAFLLHTTAEARRTLPLRLLLILLAAVALSELAKKILPRQRAIGQ